MTLDQIPPWCAKFHGPGAMTGNAWFWRWSEAADWLRSMMDASMPEPIEAYKRACHELREAKPLECISIECGRFTFQIVNESEPAAPVGQAELFA